MRSSILIPERAKALRRALAEPELMLWSRLKGRSPEAPVFRNPHAMSPYATRSLADGPPSPLRVGGKG